MTPTGPMSNALETGRSQFAACASYQAFLGVSTSAAAIARTYKAALPAPADGQQYTPAEWVGLRPFGMIFTAPAGGYSATRSALYAVRENGRMHMVLEITIPSAWTDPANPEAPAIDLTQDLETADLWINNQIGQIIHDFMALAGQPGYLDVHSVAVNLGPSRERHEEVVANGYYYFVLLEIVWGAQE